MDVVKRLQNHNIKPSVQRIAIMNYLIEHRTHPTVDEIYTMLDTVFPRWIIVYNVEEAKGELEYLGAVLETRYKLVSDLEEFDLYQLRQ